MVRVRSREQREEGMRERVGYLARKTQSTTAATMLMGEDGDKRGEWHSLYLIEKSREGETRLEKAEKEDFGEQKTKLDARRHVTEHSRSRAWARAP